MEEREKREHRQEEDEEDGEYLELDDEVDEEELDEGGPKRPWQPKERVLKPTSFVSKSKGKALKPTDAAAVTSSSKEASGSGEAAAIIPTVISDEIRVWLTTVLSADESIAISKKFEFVFEDPNFSIKPPKLDGFKLRNAKDKDREKAVNASKETFIQTQLKIMDIVSPLFDLYSTLQKNPNSDFFSKTPLSILRGTLFGF